MNQNLKNSLQIVVGVVLVIQLMGCIFVDRDRHGYRRHHETIIEPSVDIRLHT